jgi:hypothetical protein
VAKLEGWWVVKLVERLLVTTISRIDGRHKQKSGKHPVARQKIVPDKKEAHTKKVVLAATNSLILPVYTYAGRIFYLPFSSIRLPFSFCAFLAGGWGGV